MAVEPILPAAELRAPLEILEDVVGRHALTVCAFSQSFRNFSRPMFVSGWLNS
jgi:hypothetical protein